MNVLEEAARIVDGQRLKDYGHPLDNWDSTAAILTQVLRRKLTEPLTAEDAALCMLGVKLARLSHSITSDSLVDVAGYARVVEIIQQERERRANAE